MASSTVVKAPGRGRARVPLVALCVAVVILLVWSAVGHLARMKVTSYSAFSAASDYQSGYMTVAVWIPKSPWNLFLTVRDVKLKSDYWSERQVWAVNRIYDAFIDPNAVTDKETWRPVNGERFSLKSEDGNYACFLFLVDHAAKPPEGSTSKVPYGIDLTYTFFGIPSVAHLSWTTDR